MERRVQQIRVDIRQLEIRHILSWREASELDNEARSIGRKIDRRATAFSRARLEISRGASGA